MNLLISVGGIVGIVIGVLAVVLIIVLISWAISTYNAFVKLKESCDEAFATIDVYLKKRFDLIPNLVETVKGFAKHESETLEKVIAARNKGMTATTTDEKIEADKNLTQAIKNVNIVAERYPELKANTNFLDLMNQLKNIEAELVNARKYYNGNVKVFNTKRKLFPANIIANFMHLEELKYFELDSEEERKNVKVSF